MLSRIVIVYIFAEEQNLETSNRMSYSDVDMIYNGLQHLANFVNQQFLKLKHIYITIYNHRLKTAASPA